MKLIHFQLIAFTACVAGATVMAVNHAQGWGWVLLVGSLIVAGTTPAVPGSSLSEALKVLKGTLPTMTDALEDAKAKVADGNNWHTVVRAYERQIEEIRAVIAKNTK